MAARRSATPREIFLSHASADRTIANALAQTLRNHTIPVWYSSVNILGAQQWHDEIGRALKRCDWFILLLSPAAVRSRWVKLELLFALNNARYADRIIPLVVRTCDWRQLSWALESLQVVQIDVRRASDPARVARPARSTRHGPRR